MVTVRLSDADAEPPALPSPTPTLKLVDEKSEEYILADNEPMFCPERSESPVTADLTASRRSSGSVGAGVDWAELEIDTNAIALARSQQGRLGADPAAASGDDDDFVHGWGLLIQPGV